MLIAASHTRKDRKVVVSAISKLFSYDGSMRWLLSIQGSHTMATIIKNLKIEIHIDHHLTTAYCFCADGTPECSCKDSLRVTLVLYSEWKLPATQWPSKIEVISEGNQSIACEEVINDDGWLNKKFVASFHRSQNLEASSSSCIAYNVLPKGPTKGGTLKMLVVIEAVNDVMDVMHKTFGKDTRQLACTQKMHNVKTRVLRMNMSVEEVFIIRTPKNSGHRLLSK